MILPRGIEDRLPMRGDGLMEEFREIEPTRLPMRNHLLLVEHLHLPDHLVEAAIAHCCHQRAHFLRDKEEIVDDMFRQPREPLAQNRVLRSDADWTGVQMALAHHDAASG